MSCGWFSCCSIAMSCPTICDLVDCGTTGFPCLSLSPKVCWNSCPLSGWHHLTISSSRIFPDIRIFSNYSALHIKWRKYWSFSFSISSFKEYSGLISFKTNWFDLIFFLQSYFYTFSRLLCIAFRCITSSRFLTLWGHHSLVLFSIFSHEVISCLLVPSCAYAGDF